MREGTASLASPFLHPDAEDDTMRERKYGVGGCEHRYTETRTGVGKHRALRTRVLERRCNLRDYSRSDKKCLFPNKTHKNCPLTRRR